MKNIACGFLSALCVLLSFLCAQGAETATTSTAASIEASRIRSGLDHLGIGDGYQIVVADERDIVEDTAAQVMQQFLTKASVSAHIVSESASTGDKRILLGQESNLKIIRELGDTGALDIREVSAEDDGFHLKQIGKDIVVAGANPRGVLYGAYAFEDFVQAGTKEDLDIKRVPFYRSRGTGLNLTHVIFGAPLEVMPEETAVYLSRLGINQLTDQGIGGPMSKFVHSDVFPFQTPPDADFQKRVKDMTALCRRYGIDVYLFLNEPTLDPIDGGYAPYPKEALGMVKRPWGGGEDGLTPTLCVNSPLGQEQLRSSMRKLAREYPDVKGVHLYNLDMDAWFCTPERCERCKLACTDSAPDAADPWETQATLVTLLAEAAHAERPDFDFRFWGAVHYYGEHFEKLMKATGEFDGLMSAWTGSDRSVMIPDGAERAPTCIRSQEMSAERNIPFYMLCEFNNLEVVPKSLPFPFHVADSLKKYKQWDIENLVEIFGIAPEHNTINALVTKEFEWNPEQNPEAFLKDLSRRQFGEPAGALMYQAWEEMSKAFNVWNDVVFSVPLSGSLHILKLGTAIGGLPLTLLPDSIQGYGLFGLDARYHTNEFPDRLALMNSHLAQAAAHAKSAIDAASDEEFIDVNYYEGPDGPPSCKQYAELNYAPIAMANATCTQRVNIFRAYQLLKGVEDARAAGDQQLVAEKEKLYQELVREDIEAQERFVALLTEFSAMEPCYLRTSMTSQELTDFITVTRAKIEVLKAFLVAASAPV